MLNFSDTTAKSAPGEARWWRSAPAGGGTREQQLVVRRELSDALVAALGEDAGLLGARGGLDLDFLPAEKREALRRITQDYDEMFARFSAVGVPLASDREQLRLLREERERDIAALLTPEERLAYELRTSPSAAVVRARFGDGIESEEDYRKIYALQKAFDEKFPMETAGRRHNPEGMRAFQEAERQLLEDIRAAVGDGTYANLRRAGDSDLRTVDSLVARLSLPPSTTDRVATTREAFAAESQRINANAALPPPERRAQIQSLAARARTEVEQALGGEAAEAYAQRSLWLGMLQNGLAYSTTPPAGQPGALLPAGQSVFPVLPAPGAGGGGPTRQVFIANTTTSDVVGAHVDVPLGGALPGVRENVHVMTFSTTSSTDTPRPSPARTVPGEAGAAPATPPPAPPPR